MEFMWSELSALLTVIGIDLVLAGDNAVVVGMAAAGLPTDLRRKAVVYGIAAAAGLRIVFAVFTTQLLGILGLLLAGGLLLVWVSWKLWREIQAESARRRLPPPELDADPDLSDVVGTRPPTKTFRQALTQIVIADVSMSLDNVLAVAGAAREHLWVLIVGLALSVALMGIAATFLARILARYHWIAYVGLALIAYVALRMVYDGGLELFAAAEDAGIL